MTPEQLDAELAIFNTYCKRNDISLDLAADLWPAWYDRSVYAHQREAELTAEIARLRDELQLKCSPAEIATQVPDGWRLVPAEPNEAMLKKGELAYWQKERDMCSPTPTEEPGIGAAGYCYLAMLSAAPQPAPEEPSPVDHLAELTAMSQELGVGYGQDGGVLSELDWCIEYGCSGPRTVAAMRAARAALGQSLPDAKSEADASHAAIGQAIEHAAAKLPTGWDLHVEVERDWLAVSLCRPDGSLALMLETSQDLPLSHQIRQAVDYAVNDGNHLAQQAFDTMMDVQLPTIMRKGHGHVTPNADGSRARCGGPNLCKVCQQERAAIDAKGKT